VLSYDGQLTVGLLADRATCPDLAVLTQGIRDGFDELIAARPRRDRTHTRTRARSDADNEAVVR